VPPFDFRRVRDPHRGGHHVAAPAVLEQTRHDQTGRMRADAVELEEIARSDATDVAVLRGWRKKLFGDDALALKRGELALAIKKGEVTVLEPEALAAADKPKNEA
jgi:hypothetical protein